MNLEEEIQKAEGVIIRKWLEANRQEESLDNPNKLKAYDTFIELVKSTGKNEKWLQYNSYLAIGPYGDPPRYWVLPRLSKINMNSVNFRKTFSFEGKLKEGHIIVGTPVIKPARIRKEVFEREYNKLGDNALENIADYHVQPGTITTY